jgi:plasmid stability protein
VNLSTFVAELKRRNVYKVAIAYIVAGWELFRQKNSEQPGSEVRKFLYQGKAAPFDRKPDFWESGCQMKTTLDLPDELMREVKIRAVHEHKKLKDTIAELLRKGIAADNARPAKLPKPVKLRGGFVPTTEDIEAAIAWGRE